MTKPYWSEDLHQLWKSMTTKENAFLKYKGGNRNTKQNLLNEFQNAQKIVDKQLRTSERAYNSKKINQIEACSTTNPKEFWNHLKKLGPCVSRKIPVKVQTENGYITNETDVLHEWKTQFSKLLNNTNYAYYDNQFLSNVDRSLFHFETEMETENFVQNAMINTDITVDEVEAAVTKLKNGKATGVDCIPNEVIKKQSVLIWWYRLFQVCFENGLVPSIWRNAIIYPIPKCATKDPFIPLNYRGISLLSCVSKTYSSILNNRIVKYCNLMGIFPEEQNGFWKNMSCQDHIYALTTVIRNRMTENKATYCAFIDMEKAFDWVNRKLLMYKLLTYNIDGKMYKSIKALLTHTTSCVELNGSLRSEWFENICGVRQGDCLSPTLFSLYINDLAMHLKDYGPTVDLNGVHTNSLLYADDLVIVAETEDQLQNLLNLVYNWCLTWWLKVNTDKLILYISDPHDNKRQIMTLNMENMQ